MLQRLIRARRHVDALRCALQSSSPDDLEHCLPALEEAVACLGVVEEKLKGIAKQELGVSTQHLEQLRQEATALQQSLEVARRVLQQTSAFVNGWMDVLGMTAASYTATGAPPEAMPAAKISVEG